MQSSLILKNTAALNAALTNASNFTEELLLTAIQYNAEQIAYMLQSYYSREKISGVQVVPGTIQHQRPEQITLRLEYVMEEFNACSAVDTLRKDKMSVSIYADGDGVKMTGEYWPEREPD